MPRTAQSAMIHLLQGNPNNKTKKELSKRLKNEKSLELSSDNLIAPSWLDTGAKKEFNRIISIFSKTKLLTDADTNLLAIYCDTLSDYKSCNRQIKKLGRTVGGKVNPFVREKRNLADLLDKYARQLGLTPAARASLAIRMNPDGGDDDEDF
ncbi:MAG: phage terminase small subunit P27 family [Liquorilactobacillus ghanensis]|uniref:phage terminase small subunit P27 family n=1 Tax=Liquorilactobacillus ghanensis TaxID=399370 RepID=UPI0039E81674